MIRPVSKSLIIQATMDDGRWTMGPEPAKDGRWRNWWLPSRFLAKLPYRGWSWQETNSVRKSAIILAKGLARNRAILCVTFVSCQLHPLYGSLARNRKFARNRGGACHPMARNATNTNMRLYDELGLGQRLSGIMRDSRVKCHSGQLYPLYWRLSGIL